MAGELGSTIEGSAKCGNAGRAKLHLSDRDVGSAAVIFLLHAEADDCRRGGCEGLTEGWARVTPNRIRFLMIQLTVKGCAIVRCIFDRA
jgi:hypothetical protein